MQVAEAVHRYGAAPRHHACCRSTAGRRSSRSSARSSAASTSSSPRRAGRSTTSAAKTLDLERRRRSWCSTKPTRCSTWASPRTSRPSSKRHRRDAADRALLRHACRRASTAIAERHLRDPVRIAIARERRRAGRAAARAADGLHRAARAQARPRSAACSTSRRPTSAIVFCRTRTEVDELTETLNGRGYRAEALHGGMTQEQRDRVMRRFRAGDGRPADRHRRRGARARHRARLARHQLRRARRRRGVRAPHRPHRARGARGRGDHAGRAARAPAAPEHRAGRPGRSIEVGSVPTVADLRARRLELTWRLIRERDRGGAQDGIRVVVESLADEFDVMDIASAAVKLAHEAGAGAGGDEGEESRACRTRRQPQSGTLAPRRTARPRSAGAPEAGGRGRDDAALRRRRAQGGHAAGRSGGRHRRRSRHRRPAPSAPSRSPTPSRWSSSPTRPWTT